MKIIITESQLNGAYWKYLKYLLGDLIEVQSKRFPDSRFWKNDEYGVVLELNDEDNFWVLYEIWNDFSTFFSLTYDETQQVMKSLFERHLNLERISPRRNGFSWNHI